MPSAVSEVSAVERESKLWSASRQYMLGKITLKQLEDVERRYALSLDTPTDYSGEVKKRSTFDQIKEFVLTIANKTR